MSQAGTLIFLDGLFKPLSRLTEWWHARVRLSSQQGPVLVVKFLGMGSLVQFASLCRERKVDRNKVILLTLAKHRDICLLLGFEHCILVRESNLFLAFVDCFRFLNRVSRLGLSAIVDLERCSFTTGFYRNLLAIKARCRTLSFERGRQSRTSRQVVISVDQLTQEELFLIGIDELAKTKAQDQNEPISRARNNRVLVNINASDYLLSRRYPREHYAALIRAIYQWDNSLEFFLTGSHKERPYVDELVDAIAIPAVHNMCGVWSLEDLAREMKACALFITGDSGPLHLAVFFGVPTVAIWGPTQPKHFGYDKKPGVKHVTMNLSCSPCLTYPRSPVAIACQHRFDCIHMLSPERVLEKANEILSEPETLRQAKAQAPFPVVI